MSIILLLGLLHTAAFGRAQQKPTQPATSPKSATQQAPAAKKPASPAPAPKATNKYNDNIDDRMKGPNGEKIYIGPNGGRYYLKGDRKVYVEYKGTKKKKQG